MNFSTLLLLYSQHCHILILLTTLLLGSNFIALLYKLTASSYFLNPPKALANYKFYKQPLLL